MWMGWGMVWWGAGAVGAAEGVEAEWEEAWRVGVSTGNQGRRLGVWAAVAGAAVLLLVLVLALAAVWAARSRRRRYHRVLCQASKRQDIRGPASGPRWTPTDSAVLGPASVTSRTQAGSPSSASSTSSRRTTPTTTPMSRMEMGWPVGSLTSPATQTSSSTSWTEVSLSSIPTPTMRSTGSPASSVSSAATPTWGSAAVSSVSTAARMEDSASVSGSYSTSSASSELFSPNPNRSFFSCSPF